MKYIFFPRSYWSERAATGWVRGETFSFTARPMSVCSSIGGVSIADLVHLCFVTTSQWTGLIWLRIGTSGGLL
jgi:hypothetical protein